MLICVCVGGGEREREKKERESVYVLSVCEREIEYVDDFLSISFNVHVFVVFVFFNPVKAK